MRNVRLLMIVALFALWPTDAHAGRGFWGWLEELSGPGPFKAVLPVVTHEIACIRDNRLTFLDCIELTKKHPPLPGPNPIEPVKGKVQARIAFGFGRFNSDADTRRFKDLPASDPGNLGTVHVTTFSTSLLFRPYKALDIGPGVGYMQVSGDGLKTVRRLTLTPMTTLFSPFALKKKWEEKPAAYVLRFELQTTFVPQGFKGSDFGNMRTTFDSGPEFLTRFATVIDLSAFIWRR